MDLSKLDTVAASNNGFEVQLLDPATHEPLPIFIMVLGRDSNEYRKKVAEQQRKRLARMTRGGQFRVGAVPHEEFEREAVELLATCTKGWRDGDDTTLTIKGEKLECTPGNALRVYNEYPWIREQLEAAVGDRANFLKPPSGA